MYAEGSMYFVTKETRLNIRITPEFRAELEVLADYYGLKMSSYAHSVLVRAIRIERQKLAESAPEVLKSEPKVDKKTRRTIKVPIEEKVS
jgi:hypothetical protein